MAHWRTDCHSFTESLLISPAHWAVSVSDELAIILPDFLISEENVVSHTFTVETVSICFSHDTAVGDSFSQQEVKISIQTKNIQIELGWSFIMILLEVTFLFEEIDKILHIFSLNKTDKFSVFCHRHKSISFIDLEHISDIFRYDDLSFCPYSHWSMHLYSEIECWFCLFFWSKHNRKKLEK